MVKSSISTNILLLCLDVTGARTTSKTINPSAIFVLEPQYAATGFVYQNHLLFNLEQNINKKGEKMGGKRKEVDKAKAF